MENASDKRYDYIEWLSPEEMHQATLLWHSELNFVRDELFFLEELVRNHTLELAQPDLLEKSRQLTGDIRTSEKEVIQLMKAVQAHENLLEIMVDDVDQQELEKAYRDTHRRLNLQVITFLHTYRQLKRDLFQIISALMKKSKQKRLLS